MREPRMWFLLLSPFVTAIFSFVLINGTDFSTAEVGGIDSSAVFDATMFAIWMCLGFAVSAGLFVLGLVGDREYKLRYLLNFIGMKTFPYILGNLLFDFLIYLVPSLGFVLLLYPMQITEFTTSAGDVTAILLCFGLSLITMTYFIGFVFQSSNTAFRTLGILYMLLGFVVPLLVSTVLGAVSSN